MPTSGAGLLVCGHRNWRPVGICRAENHGLRRRGSPGWRGQRECALLGEAHESEASPGSPATHAAGGLREAGEVRDWPITPRPPVVYGQLAGSVAPWGCAGGTGLVWLAASAGAGDRSRTRKNGLPGGLQDRGAGRRQAELGDGESLQTGESACARSGTGAVGGEAADVGEHAGGSETAADDNAVSRVRGEARRRARRQRKRADGRRVPAARSHEVPSPAARLHAADRRARSTNSSYSA